VAFALFLGVNLRTNLIFLSAQPDCIAALFAVGGLCLWAERRDSLLRSVCAIGLFVCAVLFKQTSAAFALIPIVYVLIWKRGLQNLFASLIPALSILVTLGIIRFIWPQVFHAMIIVPGSIEVNYGHVPLISGYLIATFPIFLIALLAKRFSRDVMDERERWIWAAMTVLVPASIWTTCKSGGGYSSLLVGYLAMTALFVVKLDSILEWMAALRGWRSFLAASGLALAILSLFLVQVDRDLALLFLRCGDEKYETAVDFATNSRPGNQSSGSNHCLPRCRLFGTFSVFRTRCQRGEWQLAERTSRINATRSGGSEVCRASQEFRAYTDVRTGPGKGPFLSDGFCCVAWLRLHALDERT
jgi:hypothetical protein